MDDPEVPPLSALAAIARSGERGTGRLDLVVAALLERSSASVRTAWEVLESGRTADPSAWTSPTREFVALVVRGGGEIPLASLPMNLLRETYLHDELFRLGPGHTLYRLLLELPESVRKSLGLVDNQGLTNGT